MELRDPTDVGRATSPVRLRSGSAILASTQQVVTRGYTTESWNSATVWADDAVPVSVVVALECCIFTEGSWVGDLAWKAPTGDAGARCGRVSERIRRLQEEARRPATEHIDSLGRALRCAAQLAQEVASGGDPYPVGIREAARRAEAEIMAQADTIQALATRHAGSLTAPGPEGRGV